MKKAMKKMLATGLAMLLLAGAMTAVTVSATETETEITPVYDVELLENGNFELLNEDGAPDGWNGGTLETEIVDNPEEGRYALKLAASGVDASNRTRAYKDYQYTKYNGSITVITGRIYIKELADDAYINIESYYGGFGPSKIIEATTLKFTDETSDWVTFEAYNTYWNGPETCYFAVELYGEGTVYLDNISIQDKQWLITPKMGNLNWATESNKGKLNTTHGYISNVNYSGAEVTPYTGDDCFYVWNTGTYGDVRPYYAFTSRTKPQPGVKYRLSMRFKPLEGATYIGPRVRFCKGNTNTDGAITGISGTEYVRINPGCWTLENVSEDGWNEISAYFTMPDSIENIIFVATGYYGGWIDDITLKADYDETAKIVNTNFEELETAEPGAAIKVKAHAVSSVSEEEGGRKVMIILARYQKVDNKMQCVEVEICDKLIYDDLTVNVTGDASRTRVQSAQDCVIDYEIPADADGNIIKAFFWNDTDAFSSIGKADTITVKQN